MMTKKLTSCLLSILTLLSITVTAYASPADTAPESVIQHGTTVITDAVSTMVGVNDIAALPSDESDSSISTLGWGGPAPQITKIELDSYGWLSNGNFGVRLKVTGYGHDTATFNDNAVESTSDGYFINYGNTTDGFYWLYDCGPIYEYGTYPFSAIFTSTNSPYSKLTYNDAFVFSPKNA